MLSKYKFNPGDNFLAANANSIDPDNISPQAAGYLTGGNNPSLESVFDTLGKGNNDGKIKINVDGVIYDNVFIDLLRFNTTEISQFSFVDSSQNQSQFNITATKNIILTSTKAENVYISSPYDSTTKIEVRLNGILIATSDNTYFNTGGANKPVTWNFSGVNRIKLVNGQTYNFKLVLVSGSSTSFSGYSSVTHTIYGFSQISPTYSSIASTIQTAIRALTGKTETVIYSTNHFVITSSTANRSSSILKLMSPGSGTDISGAGATPYLDCAANATETAGTGVEYLLPRLGSNGMFPAAVTTVLGLATAQTRVAGTVYQNTSNHSILITATVNLTVTNGNSGYYGRADFYIGSTSTPAMMIASAVEGWVTSSGTSNMTVPVSFIVPAGYYFKWANNSNGGGAAIQSWYEAII